MAKRKFFKLVLPMFFVAAAMTVGVTGATVLHKLTMENPIKTTPVDGTITENLDKGAKKVSFTNNGEADVFLRVSFSESWTSKDGTILPNRTKNAAGEIVPVAVPAWQLDDWETDMKDGWYYYKKVLPGSRSGKDPDDRTTAPLLGNADGEEDVKFEDLTALPDTRYQDADYEIHFVMEIVQASDTWQVSEDAVKELFHRRITVDLNDWQTDKYSADLTWQ